MKKCILMSSWCILMYERSHQDTCEIHARYMQDTWDTYLDNTPPPNSITNPPSPGAHLGHCLSSSWLRVATWRCWRHSGQLFRGQVQCTVHILFILFTHRTEKAPTRCWRCRKFAPRCTLRCEKLCVLVCCEWKALRRSRIAYRNTTVN